MDCKMYGEVKLVQRLVMKEDEVYLKLTIFIVSMIFFKVLSSFGVVLDIII